MDDVPDQHFRHLPRGSSYPSQSRYTLQWLMRNNDEFLLAAYPNNSDAAFISQERPKPSELLLHYNYGAAAVKYWGRNQAILDSRPGLPCPPKAMVMDPTTNIGNCTKIVAQPMTAQTEGSNEGGTGSVASTDLEQPEWNEDDVMLFFWGNSMVARERHAKKELECDENIIKWRARVPV